MEWVAVLPAVNATLNGIATFLLIMAFVAIRRENRVLHKRFMLAACSVSMLFLVSYLIYHQNSGMTRFMGTGWSRALYFFILFTHIPLAALVVPLVGTTLYLGLTEQFEKHRRIARWTLPVWLYVSVTGVLVYLFLYQWFPSARQPG